jgi:hypothetical protein
VSKPKPKKKKKINAFTIALEAARKKHKIRSMEDILCVVEYRYDKSQLARS